MPFKLKLKKSRQYNVASKNVCVLSVELLEKTSVECTLAYSSLGKECLHSVCQRLGLLQVDFFGLKFLSKRGGFWWVDLDRPLKKQLDKYALEPQLYLGVMFFVQDVRMLEDEVTRYHYFLQLKADIIDGHLKCTPRKAVLLASYSLQAEFGAHDPERHTTEYLMKFSLLPKSLAVDKVSRETLMEQVILAHGALHELSAAYAELLYIQEAQSLDCYGQQLFSTKDQSGALLYIGASLNGIFIRPTNLQPASYFKWNEIVNLVHHRKNFGIECHQAERSVQYNLEDPDYAKYVWKMCAQQHKFYSRRSEVTSDTTPLPDQENNRNSSPIGQQNLVASQESLDELGVYRTEEFPSSESFVTNIETLPCVLQQVNSNSGEDVRIPSGQHIIVQPDDPLRVSNLSLASHQFPDLGGSTDLRRALLPSYRQAPDYETALRYKHSGSSQGDVSLSSSSGGRTGGTLTDSQQSDLQAASVLQPHYRNYIDLSHLDSNACVNSAMGTMQMQQQGSAVSYPYSNLMMPPTHTYSSPELHWLPSELSMQQVMQLSNLQCRSPPPYHSANQWQQQRPCSSTPDLTHNKQVPSTSPDLVSRRHLHQLRHSITPGQGYIAANVEQPVQRTNSESQILLQSSGSGHRPPPPSYSVALQQQQQQQQQGQSEGSPMGPMLVAAMNGLSLSPPDLISAPDHQGSNFSRDLRILLLENRLQEGQFFVEFEQIPKKRPIADFHAAVLTENLPRNRFKDVLPYEDNRVRLMPTKDNRTGYINASHITVSVGGSQRFFIAAQGPLPQTVHNFWQMVWEHHISLIVMLTETKEQGREKCHPYWPQNDNTHLQVGEFQITRSYSVSSSTFVTCSLILCHIPSRSQRSLWHIQYTDWPDHGCPQHLQGFLSFMEEIDAVRRLAISEQPPGRGRNAPVLVHCSAGVGRSGVVILCDIMLYSLDHASEPLDLPKMLTQLRYQRMMTVQTLAQYKFIYSVLIQYLKNSRLI